MYPLVYMCFIVIRTLIYIFEDIDECATLNPCHVNANCQNQLGTFECICKAGYKGDGYNCTCKDTYTQFIFYTL